MKKALLFVCFTIVCLSSSIYFFKHFHSKKNSSFLVEEDNNPDNEFSQAIEFEEARLRDPKTGRIPAGMRELELNQARELLNRYLARSYQGDKIQSTTYTYQGPDNLGGRTRAIAFDIGDATGNTIIAGSVSGGVYKTTNGGTTWTRVNGSAQHYAITSVAQDPRPGHQSTWYYCGGEAMGNSAGANGSFYLGDGIYQSTDGGTTWTHLNSSNGGSVYAFDAVTDLINTLAVNPVNGDVYAAAAGTIMRSQDGGASWGNVLGGSINSSANVTDVVISSGGRIYAAFSGDTPSGNDGVWTSTTGNSGTWTHISGSGSGTNPAGWNTANNYGRIVLGMAPSNQNLVYTLYYNKFNSTCGTPGVEAEFYRWDQSSTTWTDLSATLPNEPGCSVGNDPFAVQQGYDMAIAIKPDDANTIFIGGTNVYRSTNAGANWTRIGGYANATSYALYSNHHSDIHTLKFSPVSNSILYTGDDGGIQMGDITAGVVAWTPLNNTYRTYQYYHVAIKQEAGADEVIGGAQDNGTTESTPASTNMNLIFSGDGASVGLGAGAINYKQYVSRNGGPIVRRTDTLPPLTLEADLTPAGMRSDFVTCFLLDPDNTEYLYYSGIDVSINNKLLRITNASTATNASWQIFNFNFFGPISAMSTTRGSYSATNRLYIGTDSGSVYRLNDPVNAALNTTPVDITPGGSTRDATVSSIAVNPQNADQVLVVYSNYNVVSAFYTANAGAATPTWTAVEGNLNLPSYRSSMILNTSSGPEYYVGTSIGLYKTTLMNGASTNWLPEATSEIGNEVVNSLDLRTADNTFAIGTHGLGMWKGVSNSVLPVRYDHFSGEIINKNAYLKWSTTLETNNSGFDVERSYDGQQFTRIGYVPGSRNSNQPGSYSFKDVAIAQSDNYYRLKQTDMDGRSIYSPIVLLKCEMNDGQQMKVLGNPFRNFVDLQLPPLRSGSISISLTNLSGNIVYREQNNSGLRRLRIGVDKANLSNGVYILQVTDGNKRYLAKIYKE